MNISTAEARGRLAEIVNRSAYGKERVTITRHGREVAAVIPIEDLRLFEALLEEYEDKIDLEAVRRALREASKQGTISLSEAKKQLGL